MPELVVIADDLTGANDTGVQFCKAGLRAQVLLEPDTGTWVKEADVVVIDTDSRALPPEKAAARVREACGLARRIGDPEIYKKVDSTLRGNIGPEIAAACEEFRPEIAVIAPAYPQTGRNTVDGCQLLHGIPVSQTEIGQDPKTPVKEAHIPDLLSAAAPGRVALVPQKVVTEGPEAIYSAMREAVDAGKNWVVADAAATEDLENIARAARRFNRILWVGSAGLAEQMAPHKRNGEAVGTCKRPVACRRILVVAGSVSMVTQQQVKQYEAESSAGNSVVDAVAAVQDPSREAARLVESVGPFLAGGKAILSCLNSPAVVAAAGAAAANAGLPTGSAGERIAAAIGLTVAELVRQGVDGLFLTGGETAVSCCRLLGATGIEICREVVPGIPLGRILGGEYHGLPIVTKAGAFGDCRAIADSVTALQGGR